MRACSVASRSPSPSERRPLGQRHLQQVAAGMGAQPGLQLRIDAVHQPEPGAAMHAAPVLGRDRRRRRPRPRRRRARSAGRTGRRPRARRTRPRTRASAAARRCGAGGTAAPGSPRPVSASRADFCSSASRPAGDRLPSGSTVPPTSWRSSVRRRSAAASGGRLRRRSIVSSMQCRCSAVAAGAGVLRSPAAASAASRSRQNFVRNRLRRRHRAPCGSIMVPAGCI